MKPLSKKYAISLVLGFSRLHSSTSSAEEERSDTVNTIQTAPESQSGGYLKIGYGYKFESTPYHDEKNGAALFLSGKYQFENGLYLEASHGANELDLGNSAGYNFYNTENWNFDLHVMQAHGSTKMGFVFKDESNEETGLIRFDMDRKSTNMLGLRASAVYGDTTLQFMVAPYSFNSEYDDGIFATAWVAKSWQIKNWELYASAGLNYRSSEIINYYYSTSQEIVDFGADILPAYHADGGFDIKGQVGVSYPISENVLFESYIRYTDISDSISDSPVVKLFAGLDGREENVTEFGLLFSYIF